MNIITSFVILCLLISAFIRLNGLVQHDELALSKFQMFLHIGAFTVSTLACTLFWYSDTRFQIRKVSIDELNWKTNYFFVVSFIFEFGVFMATLPLLFILNSLLDYGIYDKISSEENKSVSELVPTEISIQDPEVNQILIQSSNRTKNIQFGEERQTEMRLTELLDSYTSKRSQ